jgi:hypothetical protein
MGTPTNPRPSPDVVYQEVEGDAVLVHLRTNRIYALNRTGARLWHFLAAGHDTGGIVTELAREFDVDRAELEQEVTALLEQLAAEKLIQ